MVAVEQDLPTGRREKNELGEFELGLMYMEVMALQEGVLHTKQHYLAWVVACITGARPGAFTVGTGYHKGALLGGAMSHTTPARAFCHTLRWADIEFEKFEQEYCCVLTFRFLKGSHDKYKPGNLDGSREFLFAPKQERLHLDLSALLFGEAYTRGLFVDPLDVLLSDTSPRFPAIRSEVATQAVFIAANRKYELIPSQEMRSSALNRKLQEFCLSVGILCYVSMYSFRRQAAQEAKRNHSTEDAMALLDHAPNNPNTMRHYDQHGFGRRDVTSFRLGGAALTDSSTRKFFSPSNRLWVKDSSSGSPVRPLKAEMYARARQIMKLDPQHKELEAGLHDILMKAHTKLQESNLLSPSEEYCITDRNIGRYKALMMGIEEPAFMEIRKELDEHLAQRKSACVAVTERTKEELRKSIEGTSAERDRMGQYMNEMDIRVAEDDEYVEGEVLDDRRDEPEAWKRFIEGQMLIAGADDDFEGSFEDWNTFIRCWVDKTDKPIYGTDDLRCFRCAADPTISQAAKDKIWLKRHLHYHMKGNTHSRREQVKRAFKIDLANAKEGRVMCPLCQKPTHKDQRRFMDHVQAMHSEQLWVPDSLEVEVD